MTDQSRELDPSAQARELDPSARLDGATTLAELERMTILLHARATEGSVEARHDFAKGAFFLALRLSHDDELAQDCAIVAFRRFESFSTGSLVAWLRRILKILRLQRWDRQRSRDRFLPLEVEPEVQPDQVSVDLHDDVELLRRAVERLTPRLRDVMRLRLAGRSNEEIAAVLGLTPDTIRASQSRAQRELRRIIDERGDTWPTTRRDAPSSE